MQTRRIIAAPAIAFVAILFVGAVIETGRQARATDVASAGHAVSDASIAAERARVADAAAVVDRCVGVIECSPDRAGSRLRAAANDIRAWPSDHRFQQVRQLLQVELLARAAVLDQRVMVDVDGRRTWQELDRLDDLEAAWRTSARESADAQRAAGLLDRVAHLERLDAIRDDE